MSQEIRCVHGSHGAGHDVAAAVLDEQLEPAFANLMFDAVERHRRPAQYLQELRELESPDTRRRRRGPGRDFPECPLETREQNGTTARELRADECEIESLGAATREL